MQSTEAAAAAGKTLSELRTLEDDISDQLDDEATADPEYWSAALRSLRIWKVPAPPPPALFLQASCIDGCRGKNWAAAIAEYFEHPSDLCWGTLGTVAARSAGACCR